MEQKGVLTQSRFEPTNGEDFGYDWDLISAVAQAAAFTKRIVNTDETWTIAQPHPRLIFPQSLGVEGRVLLVDLFHALPSPAEDVPLEEILRFRQERYA